MNDCKACGGFFSCGGDISECLHPEGAEAVAAAQVQSPPQLPAAQAVAGGPVSVLMTPEERMHLAHFLDRCPLHTLDHIAGPRGSDALLGLAIRMRSYL